MEPREMKIAIRKQMISERDKMPTWLKIKTDNNICDRIMQKIIAQNAQIIHSYLPLGSEINITPLLEELLKKNYTVVCPKSLPRRTIRNLILRSTAELEEGRFGTKHPIGDYEYTGEIDFYIVPGLAFDKNGYRIGYGSGYYDTYFSAHSIGFKLGICYPFQILKDLPIEPHDINLNEIIS